MVAHTPGPWRVDANKTLGAYGVWTNYGDHKGFDGSLYPSQICSVLDGGIARCDDKDKRDANARLIAAAPDLLEACEAALMNLDEIHGRERQWACDRLEKAIAKAKGQS